MKKPAVVFVLIFFVCPFQADAQNLISVLKEKISLGVKADANVSNFILSDMGNVRSKMHMGASLGTSIKFDVTRHFAIQEDILFTYHSSEFEQNGVGDTYRFFGTEVPVYAMGQWYPSKGGRFYAGVGPYFGMGFTAKLKDSNVNLYKKKEGEAFLKRFVTGFAVQIGYEFPVGLQLNAGYKIAVTDAMDAGSGNSTMLPQSLSLGVGYRF